MIIDARLCGGASGLVTAMRMPKPAPSARDERREEPLLLLGRAPVMQDLAVAGVRRLAAEDQLRDGAAADLLVQVRVLDEAAAGSARVGRKMGRPETCVLRL